MPMRHYDPDGEESVLEELDLLGLAAGAKKSHPLLCGRCKPRGKRQPMILWVGPEEPRLTLRCPACEFGVVVKLPVEKEEEPWER